MSFSGSLSNALSGLRVSSLAAEIVSSNLANATNAAYATRDLEISVRARGAAGGVGVVGVTRSVDPTLMGEWRRARASTAELSTGNGYLARVEQVFGTPETPGSLADLMTRFEAALVSAAARPDLSIRLDAAVSSAGAVAGALRATSSELQALRTEIDGRIGQTVTDLNAHLARLADLNSRIISAEASGAPSQSLHDLRQDGIDKISEIVPLRVFPRDNGAVALVSTTGTVLLDGVAAGIDFSATNAVTEFRTLANGGLSGLSVDGFDIPASGAASRIGGGSLAALFDLRDETLPGYQTEIDALARNLVDRFQDSGLDPTLGAGEAGLFTDAGQAFDPVNETGLARRIALNPQVDPEAGGASWRLRDGLQAAAPGNSGDGTVLLSMIDRLTEARTVASGSQIGLSGTAASLTATLLSGVAAELTGNEDRLSYAAARSTELTEQKLRSGVDTDTELQKLMQIEKAYAANAQVLRTVDEMIEVLLGAT
ncbi:flagellar hook-associated protein FlgK [Marinovum sp. SP66]|uniref:flagellar hook-associated protein FlgK n=1 Tax=Marinovum TaxID=367771 RepID=UPI00237B8F0C|nr:flagellar hook-associated protein FlgK [Marinovum sp. SP66]MDD9738279.1 flagellar hook-associated protein FlgK [Marinovum sp. SP66]